MMTATSTIAPARHAPELLGQTVVVIGGSAGIGLETARRAREEGADVILTARDADRLQRVGLELGARVAAFDATDFQRLGRFFDDLPKPIDHVLVTGPNLNARNKEHACPRSTSTRQPPRRRSSTSPGSPTSGLAVRSSLATAPTSTSR